MKVESAKFEAAFGNSKQIFESDLPEIVFSGKSNVGKSSLINKMLNRKSLARVSSRPGKTGTINFYKLDDCRFVDLPGYGFAKVSDKEKLRWSELVENYFAQQRKIALVVQIVDMRHQLSENDKNMIDFLLQKDITFIIVATKCDKLNKTQFNAQTQYLDDIFKQSGIKYIAFSSLTGCGSIELKTQIELKIKELNLC